MNEAPPAQAGAAPPAPGKKRDWFHRGVLRSGLILLAVVVARPTPLCLLVGWAIVAAGCAVHLWARGCLRINREVTTSGPYRFVRNPFYFGAGLIDLGICITANQPWLTFPYFVVWFLTHRATIRREEATLRGLFGAALDEYRARVPMLIPWKGAVSGLRPSQPFSWQNPSVAEGREFSRIARAFAEPLLVYVVHDSVFHPAVALATGSPILALGVPGLVAMFAIERGLLYRVRWKRRLVPPIAHAPVVRAVAFAACVAAACTLTVLPIGVPDRMVVAGLVIAGGAVLAAALLPRTLRTSPAAHRAIEGVACLGICIAAVEPWLGLLGFGWFSVLAIDAAGRSPDAPSAQQPAHPWLGRLAIVLATLGGVAAALHKVAP